MSNGSWLNESRPAGHSNPGGPKRSVGTAYLLPEIASPAGESVVLAVEIKRTLAPTRRFQAVEQISMMTAGDVTEPPSTSKKKGRLR